MTSVVDFFGAKGLKKILRDFKRDFVYHIDLESGRQKEFKLWLIGRKNKESLGRTKHKQQ